jgi:hypothetical protein
MSVEAAGAVLLPVVLTPHIAYRIEDFEAGAVGVVGGIVLLVVVPMASNVTPSK